MSSIFYDDDRRAPFNPALAARVKPNSAWAKHYENYLILSAMLAAPRSLAEKFQVVKELAICERKLAYWARNPEFDQAASLAEAERQKRMWAR